MPYKPPITTALRQLHQHYRFYFKPAHRAVLVCLKGCGRTREEVPNRVCFNAPACSRFIFIDLQLPVNERNEIEWHDNREMDVCVISKLVYLGCEEN